jgi:hypothetical protein
MKFRFLLALVSLFLSLATSADHTANNCNGCWLPTPDLPAIDQSFGVNIHFVDAEPGEMKMIADAGFRWVRMDFKWDLTERERGRYDFSPYERLMKALKPHEMRALFILDYGNPLYDNGAPPRSADARHAFARWAVAAARHFANQGVIWEIYNEPNNAMFWRPVNANEYAALALAVGKSFREAGLTEQLIGPALSEVDFAFLDSCLKAGVLDFWSAISIHPYLRTPPERVAPEYARVRHMIERYRSSTKPIPIISGEWGYSSAWAGMDERKQAVMLARLFLTNTANRVPLSIWYDWRDDGPNAKDPEHNFGLVRHQLLRGSSQPFQPKPAYLAARIFLKHFAGYRFDRRLTVGSNEDYVLVFQRGNEWRLAAWTTSARPHRVTIPLPVGNFSITRLTGEDVSQHTATDAGLVLEISEEPVYLQKIN